jgi:hypothetical protein
MNNPLTRMVAAAQKESEVVEELWRLRVAVVNLNAVPPAGSEAGGAS